MKSITVSSLWDLITSIFEAVLCPDIARDKYGLERWEKPNLYDAL